MSELTPLVLSERSGAVLTITLNRPQKKNALTGAMYTDLAEALGAASADPAVRVVVLRGAQGNFTSGNDLGDFLNDPPRDREAPVFRFMLAACEFDKPLVAAVEGVAVGIGTTVLLHCDLVFAAHDARFQMPFVNLGLCPEAASSLLLPHRAGTVRAAEWLLLGEPFGATQALGAGLVNRVCEPGEVRAIAEQAAARLAAQPPASVRLTRRLMRGVQAAEVRAAILREADAFVARLDSPEAREAFTAFAEKRKPDFSRFQ